MLEALENLTGLVLARVGTPLSASRLPQVLKARAAIAKAKGE